MVKKGHFKFALTKEDTPAPADCNQVASFCILTRYWMREQNSRSIRRIV